MLVPFFHLSHPTRGSLPGPFTRLPSIRIQSKCLDLVSYLLRSHSDAEEEGEVEGKKSGDKLLRESVERALRGEGGKGKGVAAAEVLIKRWEMLSSPSK
jgi:pre-rRNA-processing protein IPI1